MTDISAITATMSDLKFFRYEWKEYVEHDFDGELIRPKSPNPRLELITFDLIGETEKGYWIGNKNIPHLKKWVSKTSKSRFAYPTREEAIKNFITRTKSRVEILNHQIDCCNIAIGLAERTAIN